jgi:hypothetical protein
MATMHNAFLLKATKENILEFKTDHQHGTQLTTTTSEVI